MSDEIEVAATVVTTAWSGVIPRKLFAWPEPEKTVTTYLETGDDFPETIPGLVAWAQGLLEQVPPEYRDTTEFRCNASEYELSIYATWTRPKTAEDIERENAEFEASIQASRREAEERERAELARLKAKYE
jgi:hypothetical protein